MILLLDGDVLAYKACPDRADLELVKLNPETLEPEFTSHADSKYLESSWKRFRLLVSSIADKLWATEVFIAVKSDTNFRDVIYKDYKANRHKAPNKYNHFVQAMRELAVFELNAVSATNMEADDLLCMWAYSARSVGEDYVIASIDKDLKCIPGKHYNINHQIVETVTEYEAMKFFYAQLLAGDLTDNIPGIPGIGLKTAVKQLASCKTEDDLQQEVVFAYMSVFPRDWYNMLLSNGRMLYLKRHIDDVFSIIDWHVVKFMLSEGNACKFPINTLYVTNVESSELVPGSSGAVERAGAAHPGTEATPGAVRAPSPTLAPSLAGAARLGATPPQPANANKTTSFDIGSFKLR